MLTAAFGWDVATLEAGCSRPAVWCTGAGGMRGAGTLARDGENNFLIVAQDADAAWFQRAAPRFDAVVRSESAERGMLLIAGPYAFAVLAAAGLERAARLSRGAHATLVHGNVPLTVGRWDALGGFAVIAANAHAPGVFDLMMRAGEMFGLVLCGQEALETLLLEAGVPLAHFDFTPARDDQASEPKVSALTAREAGDANSASGVVLAGIEMESETPAPFAPVLVGGRVVGHTLRSAYSPALRRAIALAQLPANHVAPGTAALVRTLTPAGAVDVTARVCALPFVPIVTP
jgi:aminomethyltransferase